MRWTRAIIFSKYCTDNLLSVFMFAYDKLDALEVQVLAILDAFWVVQVWDLTNMVDDPKQISNFLVNAYISFNILYLLIYINLLNCFLVPFLSKITSLKLNEQRKLTVEARARRGQHFTAKTDLTGLQTWAIKKRKVDTGKSSQASLSLKFIPFPLMVVRIQALKRRWKL